MRKLALMLSLAMMLGAFSVNAQTKSVGKKKNATEQTQMKSEKPVKKEARETKKEAKKVEKKTEKAATTDKVVAGKKGPEGQVVYEGPQGGQYYINKNGNKTYLKK